MAKAQYVDVVLPLALNQYYTYGVPFELHDKISIGKRVAVQFGKSKLYAAVVVRIHAHKPAFNVKPIEDVLDDAPILSEKQVKFWEWLSAYYLCSVGDVMNAALPAMLKLSSKTFLCLHPHFNDDFSTLNDDEYLVAEALVHQPKISLQDVRQILSKKHVLGVIKSLMEKKIAVSFEEMHEQFKPRIERFVELNEALKNDEEQRKKIFIELERSPKQLAALLAYYQNAHKFSKIHLLRLCKQSGIESSFFSKLVDKNILIETLEAVSRIDKQEAEMLQSYSLNSEQEHALNQINQSFAKNRPVLLQGVTGSGKTHIYFKLIRKLIEEKKQVLYLVPEIALTAQLMNRLHLVFGNEAAVYHSKLNSNERVEIWNKVKLGDLKVVLSARSGIFLPFESLGLIIVDEEHDASYKQQDPDPRYQARDMALIYSQQNQANCLLGSATPSVESIFNVEHGKIDKVELKNRYTDIPLPEIELIDTLKAKMTSHFSEQLLESIKVALANKEQVILFQNRRGYSPYVICETCQEIPQCIHCDVSLTYHKFIDKLICHYCGYNIPNIKKCKACGSDKMSIKGFGTEKVENELSELLPNHHIERLDYDVARGKKAHEAIIERFTAKEIDVLIGTQMISKGLDFDHVSLVGILNADQLLSFPDYRSSERAFQTILQVGGRAGRKNKRGIVLIQTAHPNKEIFGQIIHYQYNQFIEDELAQRKLFYYPPYCRLVLLKLKHKDKTLVQQSARELSANLSQALGKRVLGPSNPPVSRVKNYFIRHILIKIDREKDPLSRIKQLILAKCNEIAKEKQFLQLKIELDVDPN